MKHSLFITLMVLSFDSITVLAQFTQTQLVDEWQRAKAYTKEYLDAMPEDGYSFRPTAEIRSFAGQMLHLADVNFFFASWGSGKPNPMGQNGQTEKTVAETKEATTKAVMDSYDFLINTLLGLTAEQAQETIKFRKKDLSRLGLYGKAFEHQTHHRGQTAVYLRLKGVSPPYEQL